MATVSKATRARGTGSKESFLYVGANDHGTESNPVGSKQALHRWLPSGMGPTKVKRLRFTPLARPDRYLLGHMTWEPLAILNALYNGGQSPSDEQRREYVLTARDSRLPTSFLDLPENMAVDGAEESASYGEMLTLEDGLAEVAAMNRTNDELLESWQHRRSRLWFCLLEVGEPVTSSSFTIQFEPNGLGNVEWSITNPIRVVQPTAEQLTAQAIPAEWFGR